MKNSQTNSSSIPISLKSSYQIAIVVSDYYKEISDKLLAGVQFVLKEYPNIRSQSFKVSGSFELPIVCQRVLKDGDFDGAIALGVIVQGDTRHFDFICQGVSDGLMRVMLNSNKVIGFGILTVENLKQAHQRAESVSNIIEVIGSKAAPSQLANKGVETTISVVRALKAMEAIKQ